MIVILMEAVIDRSFLSSRQEHVEPSVATAHEFVW